MPVNHALDACTAINGLGCNRGFDLSTLPPLSLTVRAAWVYVVGRQWLITICSPCTVNKNTEAGDR